MLFFQIKDFGKIGKQELYIPSLKKETLESKEANSFLAFLPLLSIGENRRQFCRLPLIASHITHSIRGRD